jgi:hypothetical protein
MSRKMKFTQFLPTQTMKFVDTRKICSEQHIRLTRSMIYSEAYMSLSAVAIKLYNVLRLKFHKEEKENQDFPFSKSLGIKILGLSDNSAKTIRKGLQELVKVGFIEQTLFSNGGGKSNKISNRYKFSTNWKQYKKEYSKDKRLKQNR